MSGWLTALGPEGTALALLVLGHVLGDFTVQTDALAKNKHRFRTLVTHGLIVLVVHVVVFVPRRSGRWTNRPCSSRRNDRTDCGIASGYPTLPK